jgi:hypothetical protein
VHMSTTRQSIVAKLTTAALKQGGDDHARQRELVRASLLAR